MNARSFVLLIVFALAVPAFAQPRPDDQPIDWARARQLFQREQKGEKLTPEEQAYLDRAKEQRRRGQGGGGDRPQAPPVRASTELVPLSNKSDQKYKGQTLGLYGDGQNTPPADHLKRAVEAAAQIKPLDAEGKPDAAGKIGMMSIGMSNTTQEFSRFVQLANQDAAKNPSLVIVDAAQGGQDADAWMNPQKRERVWQNAGQRMKALNVTDRQIQVVWIKQALIQPARLGEFPKHAEILRDDIAAIIQLAKERFPNLKLIYLSSRTYAGWAKSALNPEPYAYESAFSVQWLIQAQIRGLNKDLAYDKTPVLLWGPYLWTDGAKGRQQDKLVWNQEDTAADGTHPNNSGRDKIGQLMLEFFKTEGTAKGWFARK